MIGPLFGTAQLNNTFEVLGIPAAPILPDTRNWLLQQILVAVANRAAGGGAVDFAAIGGDPYDNLLLADALNSKVNRAGDTMTGALAINTPPGFTGTVFGAGVNNSNRFSLSHEGKFVFNYTNADGMLGSMTSVYGTINIRTDGASSFLVDRNIGTVSGGSLTLLADASRIELGISSDVVLARDGANILAQRNGANAQVHRTYRTYTDASNYERASIQTGSGYVQFAAESAGTGTSDLDVWLKPAGDGFVRFGVFNEDLALPSATGFIPIRGEDGLIYRVPVIPEP